MTSQNAPEPKVEFSEEPKSKQSSRKTKVRVIAALTAVLLLGVLVSLAVFFTLEETKPGPHLTKVNLKEDDTLTYRVDQDIEFNTGNAVQKGMCFAIKFSSTRHFQAK